MQYGNCVIWAILQKLKYGGYIKVEKLKPYRFVPRAWYSSDGISWYRFAPVKPVTHPSKIQRILPYHVLLFKGKVIKSES